jgi:hypothetical protein
MLKNIYAKTNNPMLIVCKISDTPLAATNINRKREILFSLKNVLIPPVAVLSPRTSAYMRDSREVASIFAPHSRQNCAVSDR